MPFTMIECRHCSSDMLSDDSSSTLVCPSCVEHNYEACYDCDEWTHRHDTTARADGNTICESCRENYTRCGDCEELFSDDDVREGDGGDYYCLSCRPDTAGANANGRLLDYSYKRPELQKLGCAPYYGLELELETRESNRSDVISRLLPELNAIDDLSPDDTFIAKRDGSLSDYQGFELESLPMGKQAMQEYLSRLETYAHEVRGFYGYQCGLHVNLDNPGAATSLKIIRFMNKRAMKDIIELIGQRKLNNYCEQNHDKDFNFTGDLYRRIKHYGQPTEKYSPVKVDKTRIEFRIFKSNIMKARINKAIDFCQSVVDFCHTVPFYKLEERFGILVRDEYLLYLKQNAHLYPDLKQFLKERNLFGFSRHSLQFVDPAITELIRLEESGVSKTA